MPARPPTDPQRRRLMLSALALAACGGGGGDAPAPGPVPPAPPDRWTRVAMPFGVAQHASAVDATGRLLVIGGSRGEGVLSNAVDRFDAATGTFERIGALASGRGEHHALRLPDARVLVLGGNLALNVRSGAELLDLRSGDIRPAGEHAQPRVRHASGLLADGRVLVTGGLGRDSAEIWDPATGRWRLLERRMAHERQHHTQTLLADGRVLVAGGACSSEGAYTLAEVFDPATESFAPLAQLRDAALPRRYLHAAHRLADGTVLVVGGSYQGADLLPQASVLRIDATLGRLLPAADLQLPRTLVKSLLLHGDRVLMAGGQTGEPFASDEAAIYGTGQQRRLAALPGARAWHSLDALPDGRIIVAGGEDADGSLRTDLCIYG